MARYGLNTLRKICFLAPLLAAGIVWPAASQNLQNPKIGIVDVQRVLTEAKAAKAIRPEIDRLRKQFQDRVKKQEKSLRDAEQKLSQQRAILSRDAFTEKRRAFSQQANDAQRDVQRRRQRLDEAFNETKNVILKNMVQVAQDVAQREGLNIVMEKRYVFISAKSLDITDEVLKGLDKRLPSVSINLKDKGQGGTKGKP